MRLPIETPNFRLRAYRPEDAAPLVAQRADPTTAKWQDFAAPYTLEKTEALIADLMTRSDLVPGQWWGAVIADSSANTYIGSVGAKLAEHGHSAEIGYALCVDQRGKGIATAAVERVCEELFARPQINRVDASLHPDNVASAMVLERLGMVYEGTSRQSFWVEDDCSDDPHYAMLRSEWEAWRDRRRTPPNEVHFVEITEANLYQVCALTTHHSQRRFIPSIDRSLADALVPPSDNGMPLVPWYRAIAADGELVGFIMLADVSPTNPDPYLWRLLIDRMHQRRGIGRRVLELLVTDRRSKADRRLVVHFVEGLGSPAPLYLKFGFIPTGSFDSSRETEAALIL